MVRWRAEHDKVGFEHETLLSAEAIEVVRRARATSLTIGDAWIFPSPIDMSKPCSRHVVRGWWDRAAELAGLPKQERMGWHSLRRKFATELKHTPLRDLCYMGGWKSPQTLLTCYQRPDEGTMRAALTARTRFRATGGQ